VLKEIDAWWTTFAANTQREEWDLPAWMERHLQAIHPCLMWEYGQALTGKGHRLVTWNEAGPMSG
jgi:hypothetical protein